VSRYQKRKTNLHFTEARGSEWQWHQLGHMQVCTSLHTDNHASTPLLSFLQAGCPSCHPTNSVKALKVTRLNIERETKKIYKVNVCYTNLEGSAIFSAEAVSALPTTVKYMQHS